MKKLLEISHLKKSFGDTEVLKDISMEVNEGEVVAILDQRAAQLVNAGLPAAPPLPLYVGTRRAEILRGVPTEDLICRRPGPTPGVCVLFLSMTKTR